jgi:hypothetical protein
MEEIWWDDMCLGINTQQQRESCICGLLCTVLIRFVVVTQFQLSPCSFWIWLSRDQAETDRLSSLGVLLFMIALFPLLALIGPLLSVSTNVDSASQALGDHLRGEWSRIVQKAGSSPLLPLSNRL